MTQHSLSIDEVINQHPCLSRSGCRWFARLHLPVAGDCNIKCRYCTRLFDCANENRPGVASRLLSPSEAVRQVGQVLRREPRTRVVGIAGPGEPLANPQTMTTLDLVRREYPDLILCLSTNGLNLPDRLDDLKAVGVNSVTVTMNALDPRVGAAIYDYARYRGTLYRGTEAATLLREKQLEGMRGAAARGMVVKVNTVLISGVNEHHVGAVAEAAAAAGAHLMNVIPLIPQAGLAHLPAPTPAQVREARRSTRPFIPQMTHCRRCRADAVGFLA